MKHSDLIDLMDARQLEAAAVKAWRIEYRTERGPTAKRRQRETVNQQLERNVKAAERKAP